MDILIERIYNYTNSTLGIPIAIKEPPNIKLPLILQNNYHIQIAICLDEPILLVSSKADIKTPSILKKHFNQLRDKTDTLPVYICPSLTPYTRKEFIKNRISFIVPDSQFFIPDLGISLREHFQSARIKEKETLSNVAYFILLYHLYHPEETELTPTHLAQELVYSAMSISRGFRELEDADLATIQKKGKNTSLLFNTYGKELWNKAIPFLVSPIKKIVSLPMNTTETKYMYLSGISALAEYTMLNAPNHPVYAMSLSQFNELKKTNRISTIPPEADEKIELQLWRFSPKIPSKNKIVDKLSLYLCLKDNPDERIEAALEELMETIEW